MCGVAGTAGNHEAKAITRDVVNAEGQRLGFIRPDSKQLKPSWVLSSDRIAEFERNLPYALVSIVDRGKGLGVKSPFPGCAKKDPICRKKRTMSHVVGMLGYGYARLALHLTYVSRNAVHRRAASMLIEAMELMLKRTFTSAAEIDRTQRFITEAVNRWVRVTPSFSHTLTSHMMRHFSRIVKATGPLSETWCFAGERYLRWIRDITNINGRSVLRMANAYGKWASTHSSTKVRLKHT